MAWWHHEAAVRWDAALKSDRSRSGLLGRVSLRALGWITAAAALAAAVVAVLPSRAQQAPAGYPAAVWVAGSRGLVQLSIADATIRSTIPEAGKLLAVAVDGERGAVWVYGERTLQAFAFDGHRLVAVAAGAAPASGQAADLAVDPADGSVWLVTGKELRRFDPQGVERFAIALPLPCHHLALDPHAGLVWVAGVSRSMWAFDSASGALVRSLEFGGGPPIQDFDLDVGTGELWVAIGDAVRRLTAEGEELFGLRFKSPDQLAGLPDGGVWVFTAKELLRLDRVGRILVAVRPGDASLEGFNSPHVSALVASPRDASVWGAVGNVVGHLGPDGGDRYGVHLPAGFDVADLAIYVDATPPSVTIARPTDGAVLSSPEPTIELRWDDVGSGVDPDTLRLILDGSEAASECTTDEGGATCTAGAPLADGEHVVAATVADREGNVSEPAVVTFTVDTVAPVITLDSPNDGQVTNQSTLPVAGAVSEPADLTLNAQAVTVLEDLTFATEIALVPGANALTLHATDRAGNAAELTIGVVLDVTPPVITLTAPAGGLTNQPVQTFSGSVSEACTLTLDGTPVAVNQDLTFSHGPSTLAEGANVFDFEATDTAGNFGSLSLTVTLDSVPPTSPDAARITITPPAGGMVALAGSAGAVESGVAVTVNNLRTAASVTISPAADGSFAGAIAGEAGDTLRLVAIDLAGNAGPATSLVVPGGGPTLPPDPATVAPPIDPTVATDPYTATQFLYTGPSPIQTGVAPGTIEPRRVVILRGRVLTRDGQPLPEVKITVKDHPEFGGTVSRLDGLFDLVVNGGGLLTVNYEKADYLPAQRKVNAPWQDYVWLPDVALVQQDSQVTTVDLTQPLMQVARGSVVTDSDGTRQATLLVPPGTTATLVMPDGSQQPVTSLHVRATEYTVGPAGDKAMPAELPPNVAYTYCFELNSDEAAAAGARSTLFSQPLPYYMENFLNFPIGETVPIGSYDDTKGAWVASDSGRVIKILSVTNGAADLDLDGSGTAAGAQALAALAITDGERQQLAALYQPGASLWRVLIPHFSEPWDSNWAYWPGQGPDGAVTPGKSPGCRTCGSTIEIQPQILGETAPVGGTPFTLNYRSDRVRGRGADYTLDIILSRATVPTDLKWIELEVLVGGRSFEQTFSNAPNQTTTFTWDGLDAYGRALQGRWPATVRIGYTYDGRYQPVARFGYNGNGVRITGSRTRREVTTWQVIQAPIGTWDALGERLGGWTLSAHHRYDPVGRVLQLGNGTWREASSLEAVVTTVAGNGRFAHTGDGGPATQAALDVPTQLAVAPDGSVYLSEPSQNCIRRVSPDGIISTVAGGGPSGYTGDGGPATQARLASPNGIAVAPDGSLYIADFWNHCIRRVGADGVISTVVGPGPPGQMGYGGDGGPATQASLKFPRGITFGPDGSLYIADSGNHRIRRVTPDGTITSVTDAPCNWYFGCEGGYSGDGGPASQAKLNVPVDVAVGPDGSLYILDSWNNRIRRIGLDGIITTVAGNGQDGYSGDGGPATSAAINFMSGIGGLAVAPGGTLYIADVRNHVIRCVSPNGTISTCVGRKSDVSIVQEGGPPLQNCLWDPADVALTPDRTLLTFATGNRIIKVAGLLPGLVAGSITIPSEDGSEVFMFDAAGRHLSTADARTAAVLARFGYDDAGRLVTITDGDGNVTTIERDGSGDATAIVSPDGQRTIFSMDANGYLASITDPSGETTRFAYSADGLLTSRTDPLGNTSTLTYDDRGRLIKDEDAAGGFKALTATRTDTELAVTLTTGEGRATTYTITELTNGNESRTVSDAGCACSESETIKAADGSTTTTSRDGTVSYQQLGPDPRFGMQAPIMATARVTTPSGLQSATSASRTVVLADPLNLLSVQTQTDTVSANGGTWTTKYEASTKKITTTSPVGRTSVTTIDSKGRVIQEQADALTAVAYSYDARGRLSAVSQGTRTSTLAYGAQGNLASITDPLGRTTGFSYDLAGRVTTQTLPDGRSIGFAYDANGNVTSITPPGRPGHEFSYTPVDLQQAYTPPDVGIGNTATVYQYDLDKRLTQISRPDGKTVGFSYDATGKLATIAAPHGATTFSYDLQKGQLASITAPGGETLSYAYDGFLETGVSWTGTVSGSIGRTYNSDFRVTSTTVSSGNAVTYQYDADGLVTKAGDLTVTRNTSSGLISATSIGQVTDTRSYNSFGELTTYTAKVGSTPVLSVSYTRDSLGRITQKVETIQGQQTTYAYTYDPAGRLTQVVKTPQGQPAMTTTYAYDSNGNRLSRTDPGGTATGTYDAQDRLLTYGDITYTYNANGDLTSKTQNNATVTYDYDVFGNLRQAMLDNGQVIEYVIDGRNRRVGKRIDGTLVQGFLYDDQLRPIAELDGSNQVASAFVYGTHVNVPELIVKGGTTYRIVHDHLGSPRLAIEQGTGTVVQRMDYDEWGQITLDTNPGFQPFGFAGGLYDTHTKLTRFGMRDYDSQVGRWTAKDPVLFAGGDANLFGYVLNAPISGLDVIGLARCRESFWVRWWQNFKTTNEFFPGILAPTGLGALTRGAFAAETGFPTFLQWMRFAFRGMATCGTRFTGAETGVLVAYGSFANFIIVGLAYEAGVAVGSAINVAFIMPCTPEPRPCERQGQVPR